MPNRRGFLRSAAATMAAARLGAFSRLRADGDAAGADAAATEAGAYAREPRELAAIGRATEWLNSPRLTVSMLAGKVVLVDFCTYTCINWLRTLPYRRAWARKFNQGLVMIGVHTPEFGFERSLDHVRRAMRQMHVEYPMVIDNDYAIWRAFANQYWPALYFIDAGGRVRHRHFGEGEYDRSETTIRRLLAKAGAPLAPAGVESIDGTGVELAADWSNVKSPETYLGSERTDRFVSPGGARRERSRVYAAPATVALNQWALTGEWTIGREATVLRSPGGRIVCGFHPRDLHLVMGQPRQRSSVRFRVTVDGQPPGSAHGLDVSPDGTGVAEHPRLYQLVRQAGPIVARRFEIEFLDAGVEAFALTFG